jgi:hypothetical protein
MLRKQIEKRLQRLLSGQATWEEKNIFVIQTDETGKIENEEEYENWKKENRYSSQYAIVIRVIREEVIPEHLKKKPSNKTQYE